MTADRYLRFILTVIAVCLVYLCVVLTPLPAVRAQLTQEVVLIGYKSFDGRGDKMNYFRSDKGIPVVSVGQP
jgi:hypothetical protein